MKKNINLKKKKILLIGSNNIDDDIRFKKNFYFLEKKFNLDIFGISISKKNTKTSKFKIFKFKSNFVWNHIRERFLIKESAISKIFYVLQNIYFIFFAILNKFLHFIDFIKFYKYSKFINKKSKYSSYDYLMLQDYEGVLLYFFLKKRFGEAKIIFDAHEIYDETLIRNKSIIFRSTYKFFIQRVFNTFSKKIDYFITVNDAILSYYKNNFTFKKKTKFKTVLNSFSLDFDSNYFLKKKNYGHNFSLKKKIKY